MPLTLAHRDDPGAESLRDFLHRLERAADLVEETLVVEVVQWGRLRDILAVDRRVVTARAYAAEHRISVDEAELRWAQFRRVVGQTPLEIADIQEEAERRYDPGNTLDEVYVRVS